MIKFINKSISLYKVANRNIFKNNQVQLCQQNLTSLPKINFSIKTQKFTSKKRVSSYQISKINFNKPKDLITMSQQSLPIIPNGFYNIERKNIKDPIFFEKLQKLFDKYKKKEIFVVVFNRTQPPMQNDNVQSFQSSFDGQEDLIEFDNVSLDSFTNISFSKEMNNQIEDQPTLRNMKAEQLVNELISSHQPALFDDFTNQINRQGTLCQINQDSNDKVSLIGLQKVMMSSLNQMPTTVDFGKVTVELSKIYNNESVTNYNETIKKDQNLGNMLSNNHEMLIEIKDMIHEQREKLYKPLVEQEYDLIFEKLYYISIHKLQEKNKVCWDLHSIYQSDDIKEITLKLNSLLMAFREEVKMKTDLLKNIRDNERKNMRKQILKQVKNIVDSGTPGDGKQKKLKKIVSLFNSQSNVHKSVKEVFEDEQGKLISMDPHQAEYNYSLNQVDILSKIPWNVLKQDTLNIKSATKILDSQHYGMNDVKQRIKEFISVGRLNDKINGKIICLIGPPGVGKTSVAISMAEALNKNQFKISMGGQSDASEIKGHRRTQVGSQPGKVITALIRTKCYNPLIILDEIDKMASSRSQQGDVSSAILDILDFSQNHQFVDNQVDVPVDLSNVMFVCTANYKENISPALKDRLEFIELSGYTDYEKLQILDEQLLPKHFKNSGLKKAIEPQETVDLENNSIYEFKEGAKEHIIKRQARESGVRSLDKAVNKLFDNISYQVINQIEEKERKMKEDELKAVEEENVTEVIENDTNSRYQEINKFYSIRSLANEFEKISIDTKNVEQILGKSYFKREKLQDKLPVGVACAMAYTETGGSLIFIECSKDISFDDDKKHGGITFSGNLGKTMEESAAIAYKFAKHFFIDNFQDLSQEMKEKSLKQVVHIHVPDGATPKDGPSAGVAIASTILSLFANRRINQGFAVTGEISLLGSVLPIGGIKEKIIAANRESIFDIILPEKNYEDQQMLIKNNPEIDQVNKIHFVSKQSDVQKILLQ